MAKCDQGYLCEVCGDEVAEIVDSSPGVVDDA
jgi:hypothetical protein